MTYRLAIADDPAPALRRTACDQLDHALGLLRDELERDPAEAVRGARRDVKKARALLRLARPGIGSRTYRRENRALRDAARRLSGARDADAVLAALDALVAWADGHVPAGRVAALRARLEAGARLGAHDGLGDAVAGAEDDLRAIAARVGDWPLQRCDWGALVAGATRTYARGRRERARVRRDPSVERLHEWRKRVKDLWYQQRLLAGAWPEVLEAHAEATHALATLLGDDHDLAVLAQRLDDGDTPIAELAARRRAELQAEALGLGRRVYAESSKAFARRLARYLAAGG